MVKDSVCSSLVVSGAERVVIPGCVSGGVVCGRAVWGSPANVVDLCWCSSLVVSGAKDVPPACSTDNSGVRVEDWGAGVYGLRTGLWCF